MFSIFDNSSLVAIYLTIVMYLSYTISHRKSLVVMTGIYTVGMSLILLLFSLNTKEKYGEINTSSIFNNGFIYLLLSIIAVSVIVFCLLNLLDNDYIKEKIHSLFARKSKSFAHHGSKKNDNIVINNNHAYYDHNDKHHHRPIHNTHSTRERSFFNHRAKLPSDDCEYHDTQNIKRELQANIANNIEHAVEQIQSTIEDILCNKVQIKLSNEIKTEVHKMERKIDLDFNSFDRKFKNDINDVISKLNNSLDNKLAEYNIIANDFVQIQTEQESLKLSNNTLIEEMRNIKLQTDVLLKNIQSQISLIKTQQNDTINDSVVIKNLVDKVASIEDFTREQNKENLKQIETMLIKFENKLNKTDENLLMKADLNSYRQFNDEKLNSMQIEIYNVKQDLQQFIDKITKLFEVVTVSMQRKGQ